MKATLSRFGSAQGSLPKLPAQITHMIDAASRGADLTQHLLAFARQQPLRPRSTDVNALVIDAAQLLRSTLSEQIEIDKI